MWKMAGWFGKAVAAGLIISFLSVWTTGYIVNSYVETLLKQFNIPLQEKPFALNGVWGELWGANPETKAKDASATGSSNSGGTDSGAGNNAKSGGKETADGSGSQAPAGSTDSGGGDTESGSTQPLAVDAFGDMPEGPLTDIGGGSGTKANSGASSGGGSGTDAADGGTVAEGGSGAGGSAADEASKDGIAMSTEEINKAKSQMSDADKQQLFDVMMTKLPADAWQKISGWMEDGLTNEEMTEVQQLLAQYLDREQYDKMVDILKKY